MSQYSITEIKEFEIPAIRDLIHTTISLCYPSIYPAEVVEFFLSYHSLEDIDLRRRKGKVILLREDQEIRGTGFLIDNEMGGVYIHPDYQRRGYGKAIVLYLLEHAMSLKLDRIWLDATPLAKPLYDKLNFTLISPMVQMVEKVPLEYFKMEKIL